MVQQRWVEAFESPELHLRKSAVSSTRTDSLGVDLDLEGRCCHATRGRLMGLRAGLRYALNRGKLAGWQLEALMVHLRIREFAATRESQCLPPLLPVCMSQLWEVPIWSEVAAELRCFRGLLLLGISPLWQNRWKRVRRPVGRQSDWPRGTCRPLAS